MTNVELMALFNLAKSDKVNLVYILSPTRRNHDQDFQTQYQAANCVTWLFIIMVTDYSLCPLSLCLSTYQAQTRIYKSPSITLWFYIKAS